MFPAMTRSSPGPITLLTDFGCADGYVAAMKGVIASLAPEARVEDAAHDVARGDIAGAALALRRYWRLYPPGSIHIAVVDPGVGSERRGLALDADERFLVGPDNGVFTHVLREAGRVHAVALEAAEYFRESVSPTFHGRDIFAPVAAHIFRGVLLDRFGPVVTDPTELAWPEPRRGADTPGGAGGLDGEEALAQIEGVVVHSDRFGNLITNIPGDWCAPGAMVRVSDRSIGRVLRTYTDVAPGELVVLVGSAGLLEISLRDGSAAGLLGVGLGAPVRVGL